MAVEVAVAMGEINNPKAINAVEKFLYRKADMITTVTDSFAGDIKRINGKNSKVEVVMNGALTNHFNVDFGINAFRKKNLFGENFTVTYAGNLGLAQGLEHIAYAAEHLQKKGVTDVQFAIIGEGPRKKQLQEIVEKKKLSNVALMPMVKLEKAIKYMLASDALLVPLANDDIYKKFIPSKLFDGMAAGKPILLSVDGEARLILEKYEAGIYYEAENANQLAEAIEYLREHPGENTRMGENGYKSAREQFSRDRQAEKMEILVKKVFGQCT